MSYYSHPYVSNSTLSALKQELSDKDAIEYKDAYRLGTLVDVLITEVRRLNFLTLTIDNYSYTKAELDNARGMKASVMANPFAATLITNAETQVEMYVEQVPFEHNGLSFTLPCRCKLDGRKSGLFWDLKSTTATTQANFLSACQRFEYYRQAYWYMRLTGAKRMAIIGVCKSRPWKVFTVLITQGDLSWLTGEAQANELAFKYYMLKHSTLIASYDKDLSATLIQQA